jgi:hypothetical protein
VLQGGNGARQCFNLLGQHDQVLVSRGGQPATSRCVACSLATNTPVPEGRSVQSPLRSQHGSSGDFVSQPLHLPLQQRNLRILAHQARLKALRLRSELPLLLCVIGGCHSGKLF